MLRDHVQLQLSLSQYMKILHIIMDEDDPSVYFMAHRAIGQLMGVAGKQRYTSYKAVPVYCIYQQEDISSWKL